MSLQKCKFCPFFSRPTPIGGPWASHCLNKGGREEEGGWGPLAQPIGSQSQTTLQIAQGQNRSPGREYTHRLRTCFSSDWTNLYCNSNCWGRSLRWFDCTVVYVRTFGTITRVVLMNFNVALFLSLVLCSHPSDAAPWSGEASGYQEYDKDLANVTWAVFGKNAWNLTFSVRESRSRRLGIVWAPSQVFVTSCQSYALSNLLLSKIN